MPDIGDSTLQAEPIYKPSGKCGLSLVPYLLVGVLVALASGIALYFCEGDLSKPIITAVVVGAPSLIAGGMILGAGRCRNVQVAIAITVVLVLIYYVTYWFVSYRQNVVKYGPESVNLVEKMGGDKGVWGYFKFKAKNPHVDKVENFDSIAEKEKVPSDPLFQYVFHAAEVLVLGFLAVQIARWSANRVFYENRNRWASSYEFQIAPGELQHAMDCVFQQKWFALQEMDHSVVDFTNRIKVAALLIKMEYLESVPEEPLYLTVRVNRLGMDGRRVVEKFGGKGVYFIRRQQLNLESSQLLMHFFKKEIEQYRAGEAPAARPRM